MIINVLNISHKSYKECYKIAKIRVFNITQKSSKIDEKTRKNTKKHEKMGQKRSKTVKKHEKSMIFHDFS